MYVVVNVPFRTRLHSGDTEAGHVVLPVLWYYCLVRLLALKDKHMANGISAPRGMHGGIALNTGYNIKDCFKVIQYSNAEIQLISVIV